MNSCERNKLIFDFVYSVAMGDATRRAGIAKGNKNIFLDTSNVKSREAKAIIREYIDSTLDKQEIDFYEIAKSVVKLLSQIDKNFTFGNAQKLINMTAKYLYIKAYNNDDDSIRTQFSKFHCPMDRIMIEIVTSDYKEHLKKDKHATDEEKKYINYFRQGKEPVKKQDKCVKSKDWSYVDWSNLNDDTIYIYKNYQEMIKKLINEEEIPLDYDLKNWKPTPDLNKKAKKS